MLATWAKHLLYLQSWTNILEHACFCWAFLKSYMTNLCPSPLPEPQTRLDGCIQNFSGISTLYRVGGGRTTRFFWKVNCTVLWQHPQITENHKYCIADPRTFFLDCRFCYSWEFHEWKFICFIFIHFFFFFFCHQNSALGECSLTIIGSQCDWGCESES